MCAEHSRSCNLAGQHRFKTGLVPYFVITRARTHTHTCTWYCTAWENSHFFLIAEHFCTNSHSKNTSCDPETDPSGVQLLYMIMLLVCNAQNCFPSPDDKMGYITINFFCIFLFRFVVILRQKYGGERYVLMFFQSLKFTDKCQGFFLFF